MLDFEHRDMDLNPHSAKTYPYTHSRAIKLHIELNDVAFVCASRVQEGHCISCKGQILNEKKNDHFPFACEKVFASYTKGKDGLDSVLGFFPFQTGIRLVDCTELFTVQLLCQEIGDCTISHLIYKG